MTIIHLIPISQSKLSLLVMVGSAMILLSNLLVVFKICQIIDTKSSQSSFIAAMITAFYYPLVFWSLRGMEVGLQVLLVNLATLLVYIRPLVSNKKFNFLFSLVSLLTLIIRLDVLPQLTLLLAYIIFSKPLNNVPVYGFPFLSIMGGVVAILAFQYTYFGHLFPNTYYLKVVGVSLIEKIVTGIQVLNDNASRDFLFLLFVSIGAIMVYKDLRNRKSLLLIGLFVIQCLYSVCVGGDYAEPYNATPQVEAANRFITQGMPALIILFSISITRNIFDLLKIQNDELGKRIQFSSSLLMLISLATIIVISGEPWLKWTSHNAPLLDADIWRTSLGLQIRQNTSAKAIIAAHATGQIPYYSERVTIDLLGKNDPFVGMGPPATSFRPGHNKWNYEYSISMLKPDLRADEWGVLGVYLSERKEYERLSNGIWILRNSTQIKNIERLAQDYR